MKTSHQFILLLFSCIIASCEYLPFQKHKKLVPLDTVIDFRSVDSAPTFEDCQQFIEKEEKDLCFRNTLSQYFSQELAKKEYEETFVVNSDVDETIKLTISISSKGRLLLKKLDMSSKLLEEIPTLKSILETITAKAPQVFPAIKRGIPVATEYTLPIQIKL